MPVSLYIHRWEISSFVNLTYHTTNLVQIGLFYLKQRLKWQTDCIAAQIVSTVSDTSVDCLHYHSTLEWNSQLLGTVMKLSWPKVSILSSHALTRVLCNFYLEIIIVLKSAVNLWFYYLKTLVLTSNSLYKYRSKLDSKIATHHNTFLELRVYIFHLRA